MVPSLSGEVFSLEEFDIDFEFDAPRFYDFSRPELDSETEEIEFWFESAGNYPPSPFSPKCNWKLEPLKQITSTISATNPAEVSKPVIESLDTGLTRKYNGFIYYNQTVKDVSKTKPKSKTKSCCNSTLTRPTASLLARQNKPLDVYSVQLLSRCQRSLAKLGGNLCPILDSKLQNQDTKRPKLEAKVTRVNSIRRSKLTVPKEPNLRTAERSERHRSKINSVTEPNVKSRISSSKRNTTNKNINFEPTSTPLPKRSTPGSQDHQAKIDDIQGNNATNSRTLKHTDFSKVRLVKGNHSRKINSQVYGSNIGVQDSKRSSREELGEPTTSTKYGTQSSYRTTDINRSLDLCRKFDSHEVAGSLIIA
ncbi:Cell cycle regulated microtubule associated protein [Hirschfeldia incana]|nr:Cell cycle regulated microtubule associated protein [Hirschfeldia incana]